MTRSHAWSHLALILLAAFAMFFGAGCAYASIGSGEVGVVRTPQGMNQTPLTTGDHPIGTYDTVHKYSVRSQEKEEQLAVLASNGLGITLDTSIRYHILPNEAVQLDQDLGPDYYDVLIGPTLRSQARRVVGRFQPEEIYSTQREKIEREIRDGVETAIKGRHVALEAVLIRNVQLPPSIQDAINRKLEAEQQALKMKYVIAEAQAEEEKNLLQVKAAAQRQLIQSQTEADAIRTQAQAEADAKKIDATATADYEKQVQQFLTPLILRLREIEALRALGGSPSSKLIFLNGNKSENLLDLRGATAAGQ